MYLRGELVLETGYRMRNFPTVEKRHRQNWIPVQGFEFELLTGHIQAHKLRAAVFAWHFSEHGQTQVNVFVRVTWLVGESGYRTNCKLEVVPSWAHLAEYSPLDEFYAEVVSCTLELV